MLTYHERQEADHQPAGHRQMDPKTDKERYSYQV